LISNVPSTFGIAKRASHDERPNGRQAASLAVWLFGLTLLVLPTTLRAQMPTDEDPPAEETIFSESLEVRRVGIEVYATDSRGNRVTDLDAEDFQIFEDGKRVELTNFLAVAGGRPRESAEVIAPPEADPTAELPAMPPPRYSRPEELPEERRPWVVLYVDNLQIRPFNRNKVLAHVRTFVRKLETGSQVMLVTFDRSLHVRESFTTDHELISERTFELETLSAFVVEKQTSRDNVLKELKGNTKDSQRAELDADFYAKNAYHDVEQSVRAVDQTVELLAGLPGRKSLVYISDGLEMRAGEDMFQLAQQQFSTSRARSGFNLQANRYNARRLFQQLIERSNSSDVTLYTIDAAGLKPTTTGADRGGGTSTLDVDITYQLNRQEPLLYLADETGGLATIGTNNFSRAFDNILEDFTHYYSLAFRPRHGGDGRRHELEVKVTRPGVKLRYRDGYRDKSSETRTAETTVAALLYGTGNNPLGIDTRTLDLVKSDTGDSLLPVEVRIPIGKLTLVPRGDLFVGSVRVALALLDEDGGKSPVDQKRVPIEIPSADLEIARGKYFTYAAQLRIGKGQQRMVVTVRDEYAGTESIVRQSLVFTH